MGCSESKVEEQRAVALCRRRTDLLAAAIRHRDTLAVAHAAYSDSLLSVSGALHRVLLLLPPSSSSPVLPLPGRRKVEPSPPPAAPLVSSARHSHPSSHIQFLSSDSDDDSPFHSPGSSPVHHHSGAIPRGAGFGNIYYARSQPPPPAVAFEQRPPIYETVQVGSFDPYAGNPSGGYPHAYFPGYYDSMAGGFFGPSAPPTAMLPPRRMAAQALSGASSSRAPPPPPSPQRTSTWDFLNFFESYDNYAYGYTPSRSSREVRDEEGIPDLEDVDQVHQEQVMREHGKQKPAAFSSGAAGEESSSTGAPTAGEDEMSGIREGSHYHNSRSVVAGRSSNYEPVMVDKNTVTNKLQRPPQVEQKNVAAPKKFGNDSEVAEAIKAQFTRASKCCRELAELLEVGNYYHQSKLSKGEVLSRPMDEMTPSSFEADNVKGSRGLSSTMQKLYVWEKKLYHEVKVEEKMRLVSHKSQKELRHLEERGAEAEKIGSTRELIKELSTKIRIAIQVVGSISKKINTLRDEELWPRITELVLGLVSMWNIMVECHQMQCQTITEAKGLDLVVSGGSINQADVILQLEMEMHKWASNFSSWVNAQRNYVRALNGWLLLCLPHGTEAIAGEVPSYSPGSIGAPPVFIICNFWSKIMHRTSERDVLDSVHAFAATLHRMWEQQAIEQNERMVALRDRDRWLRVIEKKRKRMHKEANSLNRKLGTMVPAHTSPPIYQQMFRGLTAEASSMHLGLGMIFEAMGEFSASSVKAYGELLEHCGEERLLERMPMRVPESHIDRIVEGIDHWPKD